MESGLALLESNDVTLVSECACVMCSSLLGSGHSMLSSLPMAVDGWDSLLGSHVRVLSEVPSGGDVGSLLGSCLRGKAEHDVVGGAVSLLGSSVVMVC